MSFHTLFEDEACSLLALPQELLENVTNRLPRSADIAALSQTCGVLHCRTIKMLYKTITLVWYHHLPAWPSKVQFTQRSRIDILLRTLIERPEYAQSVTCIDLQSTLRNCDRHAWASSVEEVAPAQSLIDLIVEAMPRTSLPAISAAEAGRNSVGVLIALVLWQCPNIIELHLALMLLRYNGYLRCVLWSQRDSRVSTAQWPALSSITIQHRVDGEDHVNHRSARGRCHVVEHEMLCPIAFTQSHLSSPRLLHLTTSLPRCSGLNHDLKTQNLTSLTTLQLPESAADPEALRHLLQCTPALKTLDYEACMETINPGIERGTLNLADMHNALGPVKDTLESFRWMLREPPLGPPHYIRGECDMRHLASLTSLCISLHIPLPRFSNPIWNILPPNLKELCLVAHEIEYPRQPDHHPSKIEERAGEIIQYVKVLLEDETWRRFVPQLERFYVRNVIEGDWFEWECRDKLEDLCASNGLEYAPGKTWDE